MPKRWKLSHLFAITLRPTIARVSSKFLWARTTSSLWKVKTIPVVWTARIHEIENFCVWPRLPFAFPYRGRYRDCLTSYCTEVPRFMMIKVQPQMFCFARLIYLRGTSLSLCSRSCKSISLIENRRSLKRFVAACTLPLLSSLTPLKSQSRPFRSFCLSTLRPIQCGLCYLVALVAKRNWQKLANFRSKDVFSFIH